MRADAVTTDIDFRRTALAPAAVAMKLRAVGEPSASRSNAGSLAQLGKLFPVVRKLLGEESFVMLASEFVGAGQAISAARWLDEEFPRFLRAFGRGASIEYLADIAELEKARAKATRLMGIPSLSRLRLSSALRYPIDTMRFEFHPSVSLVRSRFPVVTIWELNQADQECGLEHWGAESALIAGCLRGAAVWRLSPGTLAFLGALLGGATWAAAIEVASGSDRGFDVSASRALLAQTDIVMRLHQRCWHQEAEFHSI
jgi:hypothetical protein